MARPGFTFRDWVDWRQPGTLLSAVGHGALVVFSVAAFSSAKPFEAAKEATPIDVISEREFNEISKGEQKAQPQPQPQRRAERVAETRQERDPGEAKKDVAAEPPKAEPTQPIAEPEPKPLPEPPRQVAVAPPQPLPTPPELRPVRTPTPAPAPRPVPQEEHEEDEKAELPKPPKKVEPKPEPKPEPKREDLTKILEEKKREEEKARAEAQKAAEEKRKAEERRQAEEKRKAEAEKKAREEREKRQREAAEAKRLEDQIRQRLLTSREAPASTGATGAEVQRQASLGAENATGRKLSPNERSQLIGILTEQMNRCLNIPPGAIPRSKPVVQLTLARDGSITSGPTLLNPSSEAGYMPYAEANMRALRNCAPFRIPTRFLAMYDDWKTLRIGFDPSEMQ
jgi:colicin import membrane protein